MASKTIIDIARGYVASGYSVVPIAANGTKRPTVKWEQYQHEVMPDKQLAFAFSGRPVGIALIHGEISGYSECLDFDVASAYDEFEATCVAGGFDDILYGLVHASTPKGGRHVYYRCPDGVEGNLKLAFAYLDIPADAGYIERGNGKRAVRFDGDEYPVVTINGVDKAETVAIETRGEGGYTIAPGSPASVHPENIKRAQAGEPVVPYKGIFVKESDYFPTYARAIKTGSFVISGEVRNALHAIARDLCRKPKEAVRPLTTRDAGPRPYGRMLPGEDYNEKATQADVLQLLERAGWTVASQSGRVIHLLRPGKTGKGTSATLGHDADNVLHIFSTNAPPGFQVGANSPFAVYVATRHNGNYHDAAKDLASQGYGDQRTLAERRRDSMLTGERYADAYTERRIAEGKW